MAVAESPSAARRLAARLHGGAVAARGSAGGSECASRGSAWRARAPSAAAELDAFVERLGGERARASELLYRTFLLREVGPVAAGRYLGMELRVPTLMLFGDRDLVQPVRAAREAAARSAAIELELVPGASHFVVDERPELVAETAIRFFGATSSP